MDKDVEEQIRLLRNEINIIKKRLDVLEKKVEECLETSAMM